MSEKIAQLNKEVIKGQIKERVRRNMEEMLNELQCTVHSYRNVFSVVQFPVPR